MSYIAEQNVIGTLVMDSARIEKVYGILEPEMFQNEMLGRFYLEFLRGYEQGYSVDLVILIQKLSALYQEEVIRKELRKCIDNTILCANIISHADVIVNEYKAIKLGKILQSCRPDGNVVDSQIGGLIKDLEALQENKSTKSKSLAKITMECKGKYFTVNEVEKIYLGFPKLDQLLGGLEGGDVIVIGARPAVGKSAFVTQITENLAIKGKRIGFYNLEMQEKQLYERFMVAKSKISLTRLRRAVKFLGDEEERFRKANEDLEKQDNIIITTGSKSVSEIRAESRHMDYDIIIIDYLQLLKPDKEYRGNRTAEVGAISKAIKALAMELNIPIIALSQLNRVSELKETKEPTMAELREAGDIEQDASIIMLMWNILQEDGTKKGCKIEKQRQGETGKIVLNFQGDMMKFTELSESIEEIRKWTTLKEEYCPFT